MSQRSVVSTVVALFCAFLAARQRPNGKKISTNERSISVGVLKPNRTPPCSAAEKWRGPAANRMNPGQQVPSIEHSCCLHGRAGGFAHCPPVQLMHCCAAEANRLTRSPLHRPSGIELARSRTINQHQCGWQPTSTDRNNKVS